MSIFGRLCSFLYLTYLFDLLGSSVLGHTGISLAAFQISVWALLFLSALKMVFKLRGKWRGENGEDSEDDDPLFFPLGIPLIAGPSAITPLISLTDEAGENT